MHKAISEFLSHQMAEFHKIGISIIKEKELPYGVQLTLSRGLQKNILNIYYSEKRGISLVPGGSDKTDLYQYLQSLQTLKQAIIPLRQCHTWKRWIGSDECGKGDYLGGLVVCAYAMEIEDIPVLTKTGVRDSKNLKDKDIVQIAKQLYKLYPKRIACISLKPVKYNEIYAKMQIQKKNLNDLLAWQHSTIIKELLDKGFPADGVLVDQFSKSMKVKTALEKLGIDVPIVERPGAEDDLAVAAASILARYQFLAQKDELKQFFELDLPLGSSSTTTKAAQVFVRKYGVQRLNEIAKIHFITTQKVLAGNTTIDR